MNKRIYFKHSIIFSGDQEDVESEINVFNNGTTEVLNVNVTPERVGVNVIEGHEFPKYIYHVCITYQERN